MPSRGVLGSSWERNINPFQAMTLWQAGADGWDISKDQDPTLKDYNEAGIQGLT